MNTYGYVGGNPLTAADPYGLFRVQGGTAAQRQALINYGENLSNSLKSCGCEKPYQEVYDNWQITILDRTSKNFEARSRPQNDLDGGYATMIYQNFFSNGVPYQQFIFNHEFRHALNEIFGRRSSSDMFDLGGKLNVADQWAVDLYNKDSAKVCPKGSKRTPFLAPKIDHRPVWKRAWDRWFGR